MSGKFPCPPQLGRPGGGWTVTLETGLGTVAVYVTRRRMAIAFVFL